MKIKKYISILLCMILTAVSLGAHVSAEEAIDASDNNLEAARVLEALGIIEPRSTSEDWSSVSVTKGEFVKMVLVMTDYDEESQSNIILPWEGYESGTEYYNAYAYAYGHAWIQEDDDIGSPEDILTYDFAKDFMMKLMGYYPEIESSQRIDAEGKLVKDVRKNADGTLSLNGVYTMMYAVSTINCYHMETVDGKPGYVLRDGRTILSYYKDIYMIKGRVNATAYASLTGAKASRGEIVINSDKFLFDDPSYEMLIGKMVSGYARITSSEDARVLYLEAMENRSGDIVIEGKNFISYSDGQVKYEDENGKTKTQTADDPMIIYNGKQIQSGEYTDDIFDITDGNVTLVQNGGDIDVIIINKYKNIIVGSVDAENKIVYDLIYSGVTLNLDIDDVYIKSSGGTDMTVEDLRSGSVLTYAQSMDGEYVMGTVGGSAITTQITAAYTGDNGTVTIGGKEYPFAAEMENDKDSIMIGAEYTFYINVNGRICAVKGSGNVSGERAYMIRAYSDPLENNAVKIQVMKPAAIDNSDAVLLQCRSKCKIDGTVYTDENVLTGIKRFNGTPEIPVVYKLDDEGLVSQIDTPYYNLGKEDEETLRIRHAGETDGQIYSKTALDWGYRDLFNGKYLMDFNGMCIQRISDTEFNVVEKMRNDSLLKMDLFGIGETSPLIYFAVANDSSLASPTFEDEMAVVQKVYEGINNDNEIVSYVSLVISGNIKEYEVLAQNEALITEKVDSGDLIRYAVDAKDRLTNIEVILDYSDKDMSVGYQNYTFPNNSEYRIVVGKVYDLYKSSSSKTGSNNNIIQYTTNLGDIENNLEVIFARSGAVYRYSVEGRNSDKHIEMTELDTAQIKTYKSVGDDADIIVCISTYNIPSQTYIISNND